MIVLFDDKTWKNYPRDNISKVKNKLVIIENGNLGINFHSPIMYIVSILDSKLYDNFNCKSNLEYGFSFTDTPCFLKNNSSHYLNNINDNLKEFLIISKLFDLEIFLDKYNIFDIKFNLNLFENMKMFNSYTSDSYINYLDNDALQKLFSFFKIVPDLSYMIYLKKSKYDITKKSLNSVSLSNKKYIVYPFSVNGACVKLSTFAFNILYHYFYQLNFSLVIKLSNQNDINCDSSTFQIYSLDELFYFMYYLEEVLPLINNISMEHPCHLIIEYRSITTKIIQNINLLSTISLINNIITIFIDNYLNSD